MLQRVVRSTVIDAPIERVWAVLRDFNSHDRWHDVVAESRIEGGEASSQVGCVRNFRLKSGDHIREQLIALSDREHRSTYCIVEASVPLQRYVATVTLRRVTDGDRTFWHWASTFATPPGRERELEEMVARDVYEAGFENLRRYLARGGDLGSGGGAPALAGAPVDTQRVVAVRAGGPEVLASERATCSPPGPGEVRIRQRAIGVNFIDVYLRSGLMPALWRPPGVPGMEAAGSVLDAGAGVTHVAAGDRVAYLGPVPGAYCGVRCVPADWVVRLPAAVEAETAAALLLKGLTADLVVNDLGRVRAGTRVLVHAAAGGVGRLVCAWARRLGATVVGTVSSDDKLQAARAAGCEHVIVREGGRGGGRGADMRFAEAVQRACGGADLLVDGLGEPARAENFAALAPRGHWVSLGQAGGFLAPLDPEMLARKSLTFSRPVVFDWVASRDELARRAERVWQALADGTLPREAPERYALDAAARAHERLASGASTGAIVLVA